MRKTRTVADRFAVPHTFGPNLGVKPALVGIAATMVRICSFCVLFAVWGGLSMWAGTSLASRAVMALAELALLVVFGAVVLALRRGITALETRLYKRVGKI